MKYKQRSKEDWHKEIEEWEKTISDPFYGFKIILKQMDSVSTGHNFVDTPGKELRGNGVHNHTGWIENQFICGECGIVLKTEITKKNELGYGLRGTHTLPTPPALPQQKKK